MFEMVQDPGIERTMSKTVVYLVNTAEPDSNGEELTEKGKEQAHDLFRSRLITGPEAIYSGTSGPIMQTADIVSSDFGIPSIMIECLKTGNSRERKKSAKNKKQKILEMLNNIDYKPEEGESMREVQSRFSKCVNELAMNHSGQSIVIVCGPIPFILFHRLVVGGSPTKDDWLNLGYCSCASYEYSSNGWALLLPPDNTYLSNPTTISDYFSTE
jgi:broad specificity phosphatase PhoE